jgi:hypothetical protein
MRENLKPLVISIAARLRALKEEGIGTRHLPFSHDVPSSAVHKEVRVLLQDVETSSLPIPY